MKGPMAKEIMTATLDREKHNSRVDALLSSFKLFKLDTIITPKGETLPVKISRVLGPDSFGKFQISLSYKESDGFYRNVVLEPSILPEITFVPGAVVIETSNDMHSPKKQYRLISSASQGPEQNLR